MKAFLAVLNFFLVEKLIFGHFWNCKKCDLLKKNSWNWFILFHEFFWPGLFLIFWPTIPSEPLSLKFFPKKYIVFEANSSTALNCTFWGILKHCTYVGVFPKSATKAHMLPLGLVHCLWPHTRVDRDHVRLLKLHPTKEFA